MGQAFGCQGRRVSLWFVSIVMGLVAFAVTSTAWAQAKPPNCDTPNLLIIVDNSGSMGSSNKWTDAVKAIKTITTNFNGKLTMGLEVFNSTGTVVYGLPQCFADKASCVPQLQTILGRYNPTGGTNLIDAINKASAHIRALQEPLKSRKTSVLFLTDGQASCANAQVQALRTSLNVLTYIIGFGTGVGAACLNNMATAGGTPLPGTRKYYQANNLTELQKAMQSIANSASKETCNGKDDDCDGIIDGMTEACQGPCGAGTKICKQGSWSSCSANKAPEKETCNNKDDDCNGKVDDGVPPRSCSNKCGQGQERCVAGKWTGCDAPKEQTEVCNGRDDDCDGEIDEGVRKACKTACGDGTQACIQGDWNTCSAPSPSVEICDNKDNDCNGKIDDGIKPAECNGQCVKGICQPMCRKGECTGNKLCVDGFCVEKGCEPKCAAGEACRSGKCVTGDCTQAGGECPTNELCINKTCIKDPCLGVECNKDQFCRGGQCIHSCALVQCPAGNICKNGACQAIPCGGNCQNGTSCINGKCMPNACSGCPNGQTCKGTDCTQDRCVGVKCASGQKCFDGECYGPNGPGGNPVIPGPDGNNNPLDGGSGNPDNGTGNPDNSTGSPDNGTGNPSLDAGNGNPNGNDDDTGNPNNPGPGGRKPAGLCACNATNIPAGFPLSLLFAFLCLPLLRRRRS